MQSDYQERFIKFQEIIELGLWKIKVYTISKEEQFDASLEYKLAFKEIPNWLSIENSFNANNDKIGFLILHKATEGVFYLINWWVGGNMLNTHVFLSKHRSPAKFMKISGDGLGPCVWELAVMNHEGSAWLKHVLKKPNAVNYDHYLNEVVNTKL